MPSASAVVRTATCPWCEGQLRLGAGRRPTRAVFKRNEADVVVPQPCLKQGRKRVVRGT
jgi:hypothetical protein